MWWQLKVKASAECEDDDDDLFLPSRPWPNVVQLECSGGGKLPQSFSFSFSNLSALHSPPQLADPFQLNSSGLAQAHKVAGGRTVVVPQKFLLGKLGMCVWVLSDDSRLERERENRLEKAREREMHSKTERERSSVGCGIRRREGKKKLNRIYRKRSWKKEGMKQTETGKKRKGGGCDWAEHRKLWWWWWWCHRINPTRNYIHFGSAINRQRVTGDWRQKIIRIS